MISRSSRRSHYEVNERVPQSLRISSVETINQGILREVRVSFGQLNELYGAPASGKTTLLKTMSNALSSISDQYHSARVCYRVNPGASHSAINPVNVLVRVSTNMGAVVARHDNARDWTDPENLSWSGGKSHDFSNTLSWYIDLTRADFYLGRIDSYRNVPVYPSDDPRQSSNFGWGDISAYCDALSPMLEEVFQHPVHIEGNSKKENFFKIRLTGEHEPRYVDALRFGLLRVAGTLSYLIGDGKHPTLPSVVFLDHADAGLTSAEFSRYANILSGWSRNNAGKTQVFVAHGQNQPSFYGANCVKFSTQGHYTVTSYETQESGHRGDTSISSDLRAWGEAEGDRLPRAGWPWDRRVVKSNA